MLLKEMSKFDNSCKKTNFLKILVQEMRNFGNLCLETPTHGTFDEEISLANGTIFTKIGLANGAVLKLWAAPPTRNLAGNPPPVNIST